ncbi:MAG: acyl-CoA dehydrogenase family protein [Planctomycetota bacterium]
MSFKIPESCLQWQLKARAVADKHIRPMARKYDQLQEYNYEATKIVAEEGLLGVFIPEEYGGTDGRILSLCLVVEELARADSGYGVAFAVNALGSFPLIVAGTEEQKQRYLPRVATGDLMVAFGLSEKMAGSDAGGLRCRAEKVKDKWVIRGEKKWTTNAGVADLYTVFAVTDPNSRSRRISAFLVEKGMAGFSIGKEEDKMGIRCTPVCETIYDGVEVGEENLLGGKPGLGFKHSMMTLDLARPGVAAQAVGAAQGALDLALVYACRRRQFGQQISSFQMIQQMLSDMAMNTEAARWLVYASAAAADNGEKNLTKRAAMAKCFATDNAMKVATDAVQIFGGYGFMEDYPIAKFFRDAKILQIYEGTNQIQRLVIARNLIKEAGALDHLNEFIPEEHQNMYGATDMEEVEPS